MGLERFSHSISVQPEDTLRRKPDFGTNPEVTYITKQVQEWPLEPIGRPEGAPGGIFGSLYVYNTAIAFCNNL